MNHVTWIQIIFDDLNLRVLVFDIFNEYYS